MSIQVRMIALLGELRLAKTAIAHAEKMCVRTLVPIGEAPSADAILEASRTAADRCEIVTSAANAVADDIQPRIVKLDAPRAEKK